MGARDGTAERSDPSINARLGYNDLMAAPVTALPDVLVLGVGGTLGEAWLRGLLSGLESASGLDFRGCEYFVGSSAGSIVAASLAAGRRPEAGQRAARDWGEEALEPEAGPGLL